MGWLDHLLARLFARCGFTGPLTTQDRPRWAAARTLADLGELTALWLEGAIASPPVYCGEVDVDEDDAPGLTATLVALNRAGFVTTSSQAGCDRLGYDGAHWTRLAAVTGFADPDTLAWLRRVLAGTQFRIIAWPCKDTPWRRAGRGVVVTRREGQPYTRFGTQLGYQAIAGELYDGIGEEAVEALCAALQVTVYDPIPGPNDLWTVLYRPAVAARLDAACGWPGGPAEERAAWARRDPDDAGAGVYQQAEQQPRPGDRHG